MPSSRVEICNEALDELPCRNIAGFDDGSLAADKSNQHYPLALADLLDQPGGWNFARKRVALTAAVANDRAGWWAGAWAMPSDLGFPLGVEPTPDVSSGWMPGVPMTQPVGTLGVGPLAYDYEGGVLFTNEAAPVLVYIPADPETETFTPMFRRALAMMLAARLAMPITKDKQKRDSLQNEALGWVAKAQAADRNRVRMTYGNFVPDVIAARLD